MSDTLLEGPARPAADAGPEVTPPGEVRRETVWVNRRHGQGGSGATPAAAAEPDLEGSDLATRARLAGTRVTPEPQEVSRASR